MFVVLYVVITVDGSFGAVWTFAPDVFSSLGGEYPKVFFASIVTTIRSKGESRNGSAVKVVIGIVHCLLVTIVEEVPSQVAVIGLKVPS